MTATAIESCSELSSLAYNFDNLHEHVGRTLGTSDWTHIPQDRINAFAGVTGDSQWIHVDPERSEMHSPFGTTIAHGFLTLSLTAGAWLDVGVAPADAKAVVNYGLDKVRFLNPVRVDSKVRCKVELIEVQDSGADRRLLKTRNTVEIDGEQKPALVAEALVMVVREARAA